MQRAKKKAAQRSSEPGEQGEGSATEGCTLAT